MQAIEKNRCNNIEAIFGASTRAPAIPARAATVNAHVVAVSETRWPTVIDTVTVERSAITNSEVAMVLCMRRSLKYADRKSTRLNSSHVAISYAVFCLKKKKRRLT